MKRIFWMLLGLSCGLWCLLCHVLDLPFPTARQIGRKLCQPDDE